MWLCITRHIRVRVSSGKKLVFHRFKKKYSKLRNYPFDDNANADSDNSVSPYASLSQHDDDVCTKLVLVSLVHAIALYIMTQRRSNHLIRMVD